MTTQADITLATFHVNQDATTLNNDITALLHAIADQDNINNLTNQLNPQSLALIIKGQLAIADIITAIGNVAGASAV